MKSHTQEASQPEQHFPNGATRSSLNKECHSHILLKTILVWTLPSRMMMYSSIQQAFKTPWSRKTYLISSLWQFPNFPRQIALISGGTSFMVWITLWERPSKRKSVNGYTSPEQASLKPRVALLSGPQVPPTPGPAWGDICEPLSPPPQPYSFHLWFFPT